MPLCRLLEPALGNRSHGRVRVRLPALQFHSATRWRLQLPTHYETLGIRWDASQVEIKKQFYALSKQHHPDLHPDDASASARFQTISSAYHVLSDPSRRARYNRDAGIGPAAGDAGYTPSGSHSSAQARGSPFGARPASGLSKRRTAFRGPPPSFYRSGGYGAQAERRRAAQHAGQSAGSTTSTAGGFSPGQGAYDRHGDGEVPHFDRQAHFERQEEIDARMLRRRRARLRRERVERDHTDREFPVRLFVVGSLVLVGWLAHMPFSSG